MADNTCSKTVVAEARFVPIFNIPDKTNKPDASADPIYPGAAGIR